MACTKCVLFEVCCQVSKKFEVPLNIDAIISDAKAELELAPDLEGFMEVLDVIESLIDVYLK